MSLPVVEIQMSASRPESLRTRKLGDPLLSVCSCGEQTFEFFLGDRLSSAKRSHSRDISIVALSPETSISAPD
jgi:hypothetical protein